MRNLKRRLLRTLDLNPHDPAKLHIHDGGLGGISRGAATGRISAAFGDRHAEVDAGSVSIQISGAIERCGRHISVAPPTVGWREDAMVAPCPGAPKGTL